MPVHALTHDGRMDQISRETKNKFGYGLLAVLTASFGSTS
ncbi:hypothetical protein CLV24_112167 [Pontibacter ummariensis]|uniref:Uncharacterized protein n=1 Tax=Pontibacter ummariensis TaxID=1610492 RepID=A0A239GTY8_9BACT|nr:hypothetical protein CLV24_112167 [Pontibacter ummariensis]SNS72248.1 hypothetical protein SAMN06296052_11211 [Pontibacter ummariensis]